MKFLVLVFILYVFHPKLCLSEPVLRILPQKDSFTRPLGESIVFTCEVYPLSPQTDRIALHWYDKENNEIVDPSAPGRSLYIEDDGPAIRKLYIVNIQNHHAGRYTCSGVILGNQQQSSISLYLYKDITFDYAPSPQHPALYSNARIECRVSGQPIPTVSWRYKGYRIQTGGRYRQDINYLHISNITKEDDGIYMCRAEVDSEGRYREKEINVIVHIPPKIIPQARPVEGVQSEEIALSCKATGLPGPRFQFFKDGNLNPLYSTERVQVDSEAGVLHFRPLHKEDEGTYTCDASNSAGSDRGDLNLIVRVPPTIYDLKNVTQTEKLATTLVCQSYGTPAPQMTFRKAGSSGDYVMGENEGGRIFLSMPHDGRLEMVVKDLKPEDTSNYTCKSRNSVGYHELNGTIIVYIQPRFPVDHPQLVYSWAGKIRNMTCHVIADPVPTIEWVRFFDVLRDNETFRTYRMGKNSNLQVHIREVDQGWIYGNFTCRARNQIGTGETKIELRRAYKPSHPQSVTVDNVRPTEILLSIEPPLSNGGIEILRYQVEYESVILKVPIEEARACLLKDLRPGTNYRINVRAMNEIDVGEATSVTIKTENIRVPYVLELTSSHVGDFPYHYIVTWKKPNTGGLPITKYEFKFREVRVRSGSFEIEQVLSSWTTRQKVDNDRAPITYYELQGLKPNTHYELQVKAENDVGWSDFTPEFVFVTAEGIIIGPIEGNTTPCHVISFILLAVCLSVLLLTG